MLYRVAHFYAEATGWTKHPCLMRPDYVVRRVTARGAMNAATTTGPRPTRLCRITAPSALAGWGAGSGVDRRQFRGGSGVTDGDTQNEAVYEIEQPVIGQPNPANRQPFRICFSRPTNSRGRLCRGTDRRRPCDISDETPNAAKTF